MAHVRILEKIFEYFDLGQLLHLRHRLYNILDITLLCLEEEKMRQGIHLLPNCLRDILIHWSAFLETWSIILPRFHGYFN